MSNFSETKDNVSSSSDITENSFSIKDATTTSGGLPVFGLEEGWVFDLIHAVALTCLSVGVLSSCITLILILKSKEVRMFYKWPVGERLVLYMALFHLLHAISHVLDHAYMAWTRNHPPDDVCATFGFFLNTMTSAVTLLVLFTAVNAFVMVVKSKRVPLGKRDCGLLFYSLGIPTVGWFIAAVTGNTGPSGSWCAMDLRKPLGPLLYHITSGTLIATFFISVLCYTGVWFKLRQATTNLTSGQPTKYNRSTRAMLLFMAVYIVQWWPLVVYSIWLWVEPQAPLTIIVLTVCFVNLGGVYNLIVYSIMQKQKGNVEQASMIANTEKHHGRP